MSAGHLAASTPPAPSGIRFDGIGVAYGENTAPDRLDLTVGPGEVMALPGPSGSGKTTALRAVRHAPPPRALRYAAGPLVRAPHGENGKQLLDFLLPEKAQRDVGAVGGGFAARQDIKATDTNAMELKGLFEGVEIFEPDRSDTGTNLDTYIDAWKTATGS